jgi:hypothetical protein
MNAGFRNLLGRGDTTKFKAYLLAIALQMLILPPLMFFGVIQFSVPAFYPFGAILGGFLFGIAMNWGGGCAAGIWYKAGAGSISAFVSLIALIAGYVSAENGALRSLRIIIQSAHSGSITLGSVLNIPMWWIGLLFALVLIVFLLKDWKAEP